VLSFTLTKGEHRHRAQIHADVLDNRDQALPALTEIVMKISKPVEKEHIDSAVHPTG
jgi:hypothetical protein